MSFAQVAVSFDAANKKIWEKWNCSESCPVVHNMAQPYFTGEASSQGAAVLHICVSKYFIAP